MIKRRHYTVVELVTVIVILGLVSAVAVSRFRMMPAFLSLDSKVTGLKKILAQVRNNAVCQGKNTQLVFDAEKRIFYMPNAKAETETEVEEDSKESTSIQLHIPKEIKLKINGEELEDENSKNTVFNFYPDGTGGGNSVTLLLRKHAFKINVSPLSGSINAEEVKVSE